MPQVPTNWIHWPNARTFALEVLGAFERCGLSRLSAMLVTAHAGLSSGWGGTSSGRGLANYMLAGVKATKDQPYVLLPTSEYVNGVRVRTTAPFVAYATLDEACRAMLVTLKSKRYVAAWSYLQAGDTRYFEQVGLDGWYTAPVASTAAQMQARLKQLKVWLGMGDGFIELTLCVLLTWLVYLFMMRF